MPKLIPATAWALVALVYLGVGVFDHSTWSPTEPAVSGIVWEMFAHGDLAVPRINGFPYFEKPPLFYWCALAACKAYGALEAGWIRLPSALFGLGSLLVLFLISRRRYGRSVATILLLMAAVTVPFFELSHRACTDIAAVFFCFLGLGLFVRGLDEEFRVRGSGFGVQGLESVEESKIERRSGLPSAAHFNRWDWFFMLAMAAWFYSKNFYPFLVVCPPVGLHLLMHGRWKKCVAMGGWLGLLTVMLALPWVWAVYTSGGTNYLRVVFVDNTVGRFFELPHLEAIDIGPLNDAYIAEKGKPVWYYLTILLTMPQPWLLVMIPSVISLFRSSTRRDEVRSFLKTALIAIPVVLSLSSSKVAEYLYPMLFVLFLILGESLSEIMRSKVFPEFARLMWRITLGILGAALLIVPIALAIATRRFPVLAWMVVLVPLVMRGFRKRCFSGAGGIFFLEKALMIVAVGAGVFFFHLYPYLEERKAYRFFFEDIGPLAEGRAVYSTFCDDRRLPLINLYLDRRVEIVPNGADPLAPLEGESKAGVIMPPSVYEAHRESIDRKGWTVATSRKGKRAFVFVANGEGLTTKHTN